MYLGDRSFNGIDTVAKIREMQNTANQANCADNIRSYICLISASVVTPFKKNETKYQLDMCL